MIPAAFRWRRQARNIDGLYGAIVAQARKPAFYRLYGVPDTVEGRFELIVLHLVLLLTRLDPDTAGDRVRPRRGIGQDLFDRFCQDLDDNLREMGVGDLAVPRRMRRFGEAFYGRQAAYAAALDAAADPRQLENALARNIFGEDAAGERAARLAHYARAAVAQLGDEAEDLLATGKAVFPSPEAFADA